MDCFAVKLHTSFGAVKLLTSLVIPDLFLDPGPGGVPHSQDIPPGGANRVHSGLSKPLGTVLVHHILDRFLVLWSIDTPSVSGMRFPGAADFVAIQDGSLQFLLLKQFPEGGFYWAPNFREQDIEFI